MRKFFEGCFLMCFCSGMAQDKTAWLRDANIGVFFHYGIYSAIEGTYVGKSLKGVEYTEENPFVCQYGAEWILDQAGIPIENYKAYSSAFTASDLDMDQWMVLAKKAGAKYVVITAKHHEGFLLFPSSLPNVWDTGSSGANGRDIVGEFVDAAKRHDLYVGIYFSQNLDWVTPGGMGQIPELGNATYTYEQQKAYVAQTGQLLYEMMDRYGSSIDLFWWDAPYVNFHPEFSDTYMKIVTEHPNYNKEAIHNDRMTFYTGDYETLEAKYDEPNSSFFERCNSICPSWGYSSTLKSYSLIYNIDEMLRTLSFGGNHLLNLPPMANGAFSDDVLTAVDELDDYIQRNKESLVRREACGLTMGQDFGRITRDDNTLYLHVLFPKEAIELVGFEGNILSARVLGGSSLTYSETANGFLFPAQNQFDVIEVVFDHIEIDESKTLTGSETLKLTGYSGKSANYFFLDKFNDTFEGPCGRLVTPITWNVRVEEDGLYDCLLNYSSSHPGQVSIKINDKERLCSFAKTYDDFYFEERLVDQIYLEKGTYTFEISEPSEDMNILFYALSLEKILTSVDANALPKAHHYVRDGILYIQQPDAFGYTLYSKDGMLIVKHTQASLTATVDLRDYAGEVLILQVNATTTENSYTQCISIK